MFSAAPIAFSSPAPAAMKPSLQPSETSPPAQAQSLFPQDPYSATSPPLSFGNGHAPGERQALEATLQNVTDKINTLKGQQDEVEQKKAEKRRLQEQNRQKLTRLQQGQAEREELLADLEQLARPTREALNRLDASLTVHLSNAVKETMPAPRPANDPVREALGRDIKKLQEQDEAYATLCAQYDQRLAAISQQTQAFEAERNRIQTRLTQE